MAELALPKDTATIVTPTKVTMVQNTMPSNTLYASTTGDVQEAWIEISPKDYIRFETPVYFMQKQWDNYVFPTIEL